MKNNRLYNVIFPVWFFVLLPSLWLVVLPGNFIIDSLVLLLSMKLLKIEDKKQFYKKHILGVFGFGFLSDFLGSALLLGIISLEVGYSGDEWYITIPAIILAAVCIFVLNYFVTFRKCDKNVRKKASLYFAVLTAPYTFLIPTSWLYNW